MSEIIKICKKHGELTLDKVRKDGEKYRCKACRIESNNKSYYAHREKRISTSIRWKQKNKGDYNEWVRNDRKKNPEKYRKYERTHQEKYGKKRGVTLDILSYYKITLDQYEKLFTDQNHFCAVCNKPETRKGRSGDIARLCLDHDHKTGKIRGLLCHSCNTGIGKFKDDIELLQKAILYLEKHKH